MAQPDYSLRPRRRYRTIRMRLSEEACSVIRALHTQQDDDALASARNRHYATALFALLDVIEANDTAKLQQLVMQDVV